MGVLPTSAEIIDLERSRPGTKYGIKGHDRQFLNRMQKCGYLDSTDSRVRVWSGCAFSKNFGFGPVPENAPSVSRLLEEKASLSLLSQFDLVSQQCKSSDQSRGFVGILRAHLYR